MFQAEAQSKQPCCFVCDEGREAGSSEQLWLLPAPSESARNLSDFHFVSKITELRSCVKCVCVCFLVEGTLPAEDIYSSVDELV